MNLMLRNCYNFNNPVDVVYQEGKLLENQFKKRLSKMPTVEEEIRFNMKTVSLASSKKKNTLTRANTEIFPPEAENTVRCDELEENSSLHSGLTQNMNKLTIQDHQETSFDEQTPSDMLEELDGTSGQHCGLTQKINELSLGQGVDLDVGATTGGVFAPDTLSSTGLTQQLEQLTLEADTREDEEHLQSMPEPSNRRVLDRETRGKVEQGEDDGAAVTPNDETEKEDSLQLAGAKWGPLEGSEIATKLNEVFLEVARWRRNIFYLPTGKAGEDFIEELSRIFEMFSSGSAFEPVALTMAVVIFPLVLQKPTRDSKAADHKRYLEKRLKAWKTGELDDLLKEGRVIQKRLKRKKKSKSVRKEKRFIQLMEAGKVSAALRCIGSQETSVLDTTPEVLQQLRDKHPPSENPHIRSLIQAPYRECLLSKLYMRKYTVLKSTRLQSQSVAQQAHQALTLIFGFVFFARNNSSQSPQSCVKLSQPSQGSSIRVK